MPENNDRKRFPGLSSSSFEHPTDRAALAALKRAPGLDWVFRKFNEYTSDRAAKLYCLSDTVRVDQNQCAGLHRQLVECCETLDMPIPQLYIDQHPYANALTFGVESPIILVYSGLLELLDEDEWRVILGHELGHIKSGHVLYRQIARFLARLAQQLGARTFGLGQGLAMGLFYAFFHWYRQSELTADRAALLVTQDKERVVRAQMKLAGGSRKLYEQMSREAFLAQGRDYHEMGKDILNQVFKMGMELNTTHPFLAVRALEIDSWADGPEYAAILRGEYMRENRSASSPSAEAFADTPPDDARKCPNCGSMVLYRAFVFCPNCGADMPRG
jgi:Zn-dependent protease with chaperone function